MPCNSIKNILIQDTPVLKFHRGLHTTICVLILLYMRAHTTMYVSSYWRESVCVYSLTFIESCCSTNSRCFVVIKREHAFTHSFSLIKKGLFDEKKVLWNSILKFHHGLYTCIYVSSYYYICVLTILCMCPHAAMCPHITLCAFSYSYICLSHFLAFVLHAGQGVGKRATKVRVTTRTSRFTR